LPMAVGVAYELSIRASLYGKLCCVVRLANLQSTKFAGTSQTNSTTCLAHILTYPRTTMHHAHLDLPTPVLCCLTLLSISKLWLINAYLHLSMFTWPASSKLFVLLFRQQKEKQRAKEYDKKREEKQRNRQLYHMRHSKVWFCGRRNPYVLESRILILFWSLGILYFFSKEQAPCMRERSLIARH